MKTEYKDTVTKGKMTCGFCSTGNHDSCRGGYRNGDGSVLICACECAESKTEFCHHCHTTEADHLGRPWLCDDREACEGRLRTRIESSEFYQSLNKYFSPEDRRNATVRHFATKRGGECLCCGEPTKGGKFLPGHDSKWLNLKISEIRGGIISRANQVKAVAEFSPALAVKLEKRLDGKFA